MAKRPVFVVVPKKVLFVRCETEFEFFGGFSDKQKQRCIRSLHESFSKRYPEKKILEISGKSEDPLGVQLSAFNLMMETKSGKKLSVESAFQGSKVFEKGGPYVDLLDAPSIAAKKDGRLRSSGAVIGFRLEGEDFPTEPKTLFYHWLYINALAHQPELGDRVMEYDAFTDIVFNPQKSLNCQAEAVAIYVSLRRQGLLEAALQDLGSFQKIVYAVTLDLY